MIYLFSECKFSKKNEEIKGVIRGQHQKRRYVCKRLQVDSDDFDKEKIRRVLSVFLWKEGACNIAKAIGMVVRLPIRCFDNLLLFFHGGQF